MSDEARAVPVDGDRGRLLKLADEWNEITSADYYQSSAVRNFVVWADLRAGVSLTGSGLDVERLRHARAVATIWRDAAIRYTGTEMSNEFWKPVAHAMNLVLAALDGETDPNQLGVDEDELAAALSGESGEPTR